MPGLGEQDRIINHGHAGQNILDIKQSNNSFKKNIQKRKQASQSGLDRFKSDAAASLFFIQFYLNLVVY